MGPNITGDERIHFNSELVNPPISNGERKKMMAREHNRAYNAGELDKKDDLTESVLGIVKGFQNALVENSKS